MKRLGKQKRGMALVITLSALVLITALILAFFSRSLVNRQIAFSSTNIAKADLLARSALEVITGELRNEIADPTRSTVTTVSGITVYRPTTPADLLMRPLGTNAPTGSVVKVSASGIPIRPTGTIVGSAVSIGTSSQNGRYLSSSRWFGTGGPQLGSQAQLPTWVFLTRQSGMTTPSIAAAKTPSDPGYVIGRFAYTVYDTGGLLDANVAGYPTGTTVAEIGMKGSAAYADLTTVGLAETALANWRNASTKTTAEDFREWATGVPRTTGTANTGALRAALSGYLTVVQGDNAILSRRDLLRNPNTSAAVGSLTHFSRTLAGPTWSPSLNAGGSYDYQANANSPTAVNRNLSNVRFGSAGTVTHYLDDGTSETYPVSAGTPLLQRRFSLAKLAWLTHQGPKTGISGAAILNCFGLRWSAAGKRWDYVPVNGSSSIKTLDEVSAEASPREPNFIELLKAGILSGSVGRAADNKTIAELMQNTLDGVGDLQILRIGANILDCADTDNYPSTFTLNFAGIAVPVHGVEDLPYLFNLPSGLVRFTDSKDAENIATLGYAAFILKVSLFNPHRPSIPLASAKPSNIRIRVKSGTLLQLGLWGTSPGRPSPDPHPEIPTLYDFMFRDFTGDPINSDLSNRPAVLVPSSAFENFRNSPKGVDKNDNSEPSTLITTLAAPFTNSGVEIDHGFLLYRYIPKSKYVWSSIGYNSYASMSNVIVVVEYQDIGGNWYIYDTLAGNEALTNSGIGGASGPSLPYTTGFTSQYDTSVGRGNAATAEALIKLDPRTTRFGIMQNNRAYPNDVPLNILFRHLSIAQPFAPATANLFPGLWTEGGRTPWNTTQGSNIADPDGVTRPADAWINASGNSSGSTDTNQANVFRKLTGDPGRRPVILQRPYRSVGELGYVFRDSPWKTLSFFDESSADAALLDIFSISDAPTMTAGKSHLDSLLPANRQALMKGSGQAEDGTNPLGAAAPAALATAFKSFAFAADGTPNAELPLTSAGLSSFMYSDTVSTSLKGNSNLDNVKYRREAVVRSVVDSSQTRTWNLLIDVVAQTGKYPETATSLDTFIVEGEKRYWLSVAIDRYTGKVIDQQLEPVSE